MNDTPLRYDGRIFVSSSLDLDFALLPPIRESAYPAFPFCVLWLLLRFFGSFLGFLQDEAAFVSLSGMKAGAGGTRTVQA